MRTINLTVLTSPVIIFQIKLKFEMKLLSSIIIGAIHCSQQSVKQPAALDEFADQRLTCRQQCFKYETVDIEFLSISFSEIFGFKQSNAH